MTTVIIRTYAKNEHVAMKCYESMKALNVADKYCFFVERGGAIPNIVATGEPIYYHETCGNFGGLFYVKRMVRELNQIPRPNDNDYIIYSDDDIVMHKNPMDIMTADHAGIVGEAMVCDNVPHFSGQLNIVKGWLWNKYLDGGEEVVEECYQYQLNNNSVAGTADDTLFSIFSYLNKATKQSFHQTYYWSHER